VTVGVVVGELIVGAVAVAVDAAVAGAVVGDPVTVEEQPAAHAIKANPSSAGGGVANRDKPLVITLDYRQHAPICDGHRVGRCRTVLLFPVLLIVGAPE